MLTILTFFPLLGVFFLSFVKEHKNAYSVALWLTFVHLILSLGVWVSFDANQMGYQFVTKHVWFKELALHFGVDHVSILFLPLTSLLVFLCVLGSAIDKSVAYWKFILLAEFAIVGAFCSLNFILFYIFFEAVLIPCFFLITMWGGEGKSHAAVKFFVYTFAGSILMLIGLVMLYCKTGIDNFDAMHNMARPLSIIMQHKLWWLFVLSFAIKIPMVPFHTWLPHAHVEAPMAGSVLLAGIMIKMGAYGLLRLAIPLTADVCHLYAPYMMWLSAGTVVYGSLLAYAQTDIKRLIAYSSVAHMGYVTLGLFSLSTKGVVGAVIQMLSHGVISAGLFFIIGFLYERTHNRDMAFYKGLVTLMPGLSLAMMLFTLSSVALPGTVGFWGEFLVLAGAFSIQKSAVYIASAGMVLGAIYMLRLYRVCFWGDASQGVSIKALNWRESTVLITLSVITVVCGIYPKPFMDMANKASQEVLRNYAR